MPVIVDAPSPNFDERAGGEKVSCLILHYTGTQTAAHALQLLTDAAAEKKVSAHYLVDEDGKIFRIVDESKRAWHAGASLWEGRADLNSRSIGIEIQNAGHEFGLPPYPQVQMEAVVELCKGILSRHAIPPYNVLAHSDIAPARKSDPGEHFPWQALAAQGIGIWPEVTPADTPDGTEDMAALLALYGYDPGLPLQESLTAFQRHFVPEVFKSGSGTADINTVKILKALIRKKNFLRKQNQDFA